MSVESDAYEQLCALSDLWDANVTSNFGDHKDQVYLVPFNICSWLSFLLGSVENLGVFSSTTLNFISELGPRICVHTGDARETSYLFQRISVMLQRFNSVLLHDTLPVDLPDL